MCGPGYSPGCLRPLGHPDLFICRNGSNIQYELNCRKLVYAWGGEKSVGEKFDVSFNMTPAQELVFVIVDGAQTGTKCVITRDEQDRRKREPSRNAIMIAVGSSTSHPQPQVYLTVAEHNLVQAFAEHFLKTPPPGDLQTASKETQTECNDEAIAVTEEQEFQAVMQVVIATHGQHVQDGAQLDAVLQDGPTFGSAEYSDAIAQELLAMQDMLSQ